MLQASSASFTPQMQQAAMTTQSFNNSMQSSPSLLQALNNTIPTTNNNLIALSTAAQSGTANINALVSAVINAANAIRGKAAEIAAIVISVPKVTTYAVNIPAVAVAQNAIGGIYGKGSFLTTFAERSPEAAIPIDNSQRSRDLWTKTGQLLGLIPGTPHGFDAPKFNSNQSIIRSITNYLMPSSKYRMAVENYADYFMRDNNLMTVTRAINNYSSSNVASRFFNIIAPDDEIDSIIQRYNEIKRIEQVDDAPDFNINIHITINGDADASAVKSGVEQAIPALERTFSEQLADYNHEKARRSFR